MSRLLPSAFLRGDVFFIILSFSQGGFSGAEYADGIAALGETDDEQAILVRVSNDDLADFLARVFLVVEDTRQWIGEYGERLLERYAMLGLIGCRFLRVPLKLQPDSTLTTLKQARWGQRWNHYPLL